jgi:hypothetical protein
MRSDLSEHYCCVQKGISSYMNEHNYFQIAQIYKLFKGISYVFLKSYVHCEQTKKLIVKRKLFFLITVTSITYRVSNHSTRLIFLSKHNLINFE